MQLSDLAIALNGRQALRQVSRMARMDSSSQKKSRLRRILDWELPGSYAGFRSDKTFRVRMLPELLHFEAGRERFEAFSKARAKAGRPALSFLVLIGVILIVWAGRVSLFFFGGSVGNIADPVFGVLIYGLLAGSPLLLIWLWNRRLRRSLRVQLRRKGVFLCIPCGYDLTGNVSGRCPECGAGIIPTDGC